MRIAVLGLIAVCLTGCASPIVIRDARTNLPDKIEPLSTHLHNGTRDVLIFFVHGVADHCPGYALDDTTGWFDHNTQVLLHLTPDGDAGKIKAAKLQDPAHWQDAPDRLSTYTVAGRTFTYLGAAGKQKKVTVAEVTWSGLTRWVKTKQLGFDLTEAIKASPHKEGAPDENDDFENCEEGAPAAFDQSRVLVNRILKEQVLDRSISDAVLYVGSYGTKINLAMADGLCRGLTGNFDKKKSCDWDAAVAAADDDRAVFFVTHSLGSRIVYDTLLEMAIPDHPTRKDNPAFGAVPTVTQRTSVAKNVLRHNSVTFMMANQLPLLGLTYVPAGYRSTDNDTAYLSRVDTGEKALKLFGSGPTHVSLDVDATEATSQLQCGPNPVACAALFRYQATDEKRKREGAGDKPDPLEVVAFSDTNDLLTYAVPASYTDDKGNIRFKFTNAYVHNSTRWLGLLENPASAHENYFVNDTVRRVIVCGGNDTTVSTCR